MSCAFLSKCHSFPPIKSSIHSVLFQQEMEDKVISPEKAEEAKLKARYPNLGAKPGGSDLLRKRLQKGVRFIPKLSYLLI